MFESEAPAKILRKRKTWLELKSVVEKSRKIAYALNSDVPLQIKFRDYGNESGSAETRLYFLSGTARRETTLKYVNVQQNQTTGVLEENILFNAVPSGALSAAQKLTKEEQLLRERKRCSFNGITSYVLDSTNGRLIFSERSGLFYYDDNQQVSDYPNEIEVNSKGAIDIKICPYDHNLISYVINGDLWVKHLQTNQEVRLTESKEFCTAGVASYIMQEEFDRYSGYWWQPVKGDTHRIVYEVVDDTDVDVVYITPSCVDENGYDTYKYPRAGSTNSKITLKLVEFKLPSTSDSQPLTIEYKSMANTFNELFNWFEYLTRAEWTPNGEYFWVQILDRLQQHSAHVLIPLGYFCCDGQSTTNEKVIVLSEQVSDTWINQHNTMYMFQQAANDRELSFITANDESRYLHLYKQTVSLNPQDFQPESVNVVRTRTVSRVQLTSGQWCVEWKENVSVDVENNLVYFIGYKNPLESQLFVVSLTEPLKVKQLTPDGFSHAISMNRSCTLFVSVFSNLANQNKAAVYQIINQKHSSLDKLNASQIASIAGSELSRPNETYLQSDMPYLSSEDIERSLEPPQVFKFRSSDNAEDLYGLIYKPSNYVPNVKYPTVLYVYGGPHVQLVSNTYKANKFMRLHMLSMLGYCVVTVDSRGSDYRGVDFESHIRHRMGQVEIEDQVTGLQYAAQAFQCIDMNRVGIFGWSYGGYMSLMGLAQRPDIFKVAVSGAPVTQWELYDTGYTERYMGVPQVNVEAYARGSVLNWVKSFPNEENRLLIIHGMIDENVHFAHTRKLIDALVRDNKPYTLQVYPNERHGIRSPEASIHCDLNLFSFLEQNL